MNEQSKAATRRARDPNFAHRYFVGDGIDIGCGHDPLGNYQHLFPAMRSCRPWDTLFGDGDAMLMDGVPDHTFDFVTSAHCLEHLHDPKVALTHWLRITKPGGHIVITFPDEDLYEQGVWPSTFNPDHKATFTLHKATSWSPVSVNVLRLLADLPPEADVRKVEVMDWANYPIPYRVDQTMTPVAESAIEVVIRKRHKHEIAQGGHFSTTPPPAPKDNPAGGSENVEDTTDG